MKYPEDSLSNRPLKTLTMLPPLPFFRASISSCRAWINSDIIWGGDDIYYSPFKLLCVQLIFRIQIIQHCFFGYYFSVCLPFPSFSLKCFQYRLRHECFAEKQRPRAVADSRV